LIVRYFFEELKIVSILLDEKKNHAGLAAVLKSAGRVFKMANNGFNANLAACISLVKTRR
jgi:hypothetical protein